MPLEWEERKRLLRIAGLTEELLHAARASRHQATSEGLGEQVRFLMSEVHGTLAEIDRATADEFERIVMRAPQGDTPAELRAAALVGWLKAELAAEAMDEKREEEAASRPQPRRKQTIGFKIRSPITREHRIPEPPASSE